MNRRYITCCVDCGDGEAINEMMEHAKETSYAVFRRLMGREDMEGIRRHFNYDRTKRQGLTIANDWHIRYYRGTWKGEPVLIFKHSAIEYIFRHAA